MQFLHLGDPDVHYAGVIVLNAKTLREIGRAEFCLDGPAPKPLHGCFSPHKGIITIPENISSWEA